MKHILLNLLAGTLCIAATAQSWTPVLTTPGTVYYTAAIADDTTVYVGGPGGSAPHLRKSVDGGVTFSPLSISFAPLCAAFTSADTGCIGSATASPSSGSIYRTTNGGMSWTPVLTTAPSPIKDVAFSSSSVGYAIASATGPTSTDSAAIYKTTDGGLSWTSIATLPPTRLNKISMVDDSTGYIVGCDYAGPQAKLITIRHGAVFSNVNISAHCQFYGVDFISADTGFAVGYDCASSPFSDHIFKTTDGGLSWTVIYTAPSYYNIFIKFVNSSNGFAIGGTNVQTTDGGNTWTAFSPWPPTSGSVNGGDFRKNLGIIAGEGWVARNGAITAIVATPILEDPAVTFKVYPNPASSTVQVVFDGKSENATLTITDVTGRELRRIPFSNNNLTVEVGDLNKGLYLLHVTDTDGIKATTRLAIQ